VGKKPARRKQLETATTKIINAWQSLDAGLRELDDLRDALRPPDAPGGDPIVATYAQISEMTAGAVSWTGARWIVDRYHKQETKP
jgi:hypothetical protein